MPPKGVSSGDGEGASSDSATRTSLKVRGEDLGADVGLDGCSTVAASVARGSQGPRDDCLPGGGKDKPSINGNGDCPIRINTPCVCSWRVCMCHVCRAAGAPVRAQHAGVVRGVRLQDGCSESGLGPACAEASSVVAVLFRLCRGGIG